MLDLDEVRDEREDDRDLEQVKRLAADVVLRHAHEVALVVEASSVVSATDDRMHDDDIEDVAEEDHAAIVIQRQKINQLRRGVGEGGKSTRMGDLKLAGLDFK